ncbi:MAG TPA: hypothetical protein PK079_00690 [Leptospiraceae bacterium]|nr:hypothetical protein [Leptospiraceae bacterium]HMW03972.1 hypothetical protein [Leptospiraceae bacterium]HMX33610.1 hypothetical protein [Leptospiraceae bacterium]HMY29952.1 hypothetical protein [Leptospiraceae bacterium]HMZ66771.1 hypothetical protein [Leptospiraceae bacterium]
MSIETATQEKPIVQTSANNPNPIKPESRKRPWYKLPTGKQLGKRIISPGNSIYVALLLSIVMVGVHITFLPTLFAQIYEMSYESAFMRSLILSLVASFSLLLLKLKLKPTAFRLPWYFSKEGRFGKLTLFRANIPATLLMIVNIIFTFSGMLYDIKGQPQAVKEFIETVVVYNINFVIAVLPEVVVFYVLFDVYKNLRDRKKHTKLAPEKLAAMEKYINDNKNEPNFSLSFAAKVAGIQVTQAKPFLIEKYGAEEYERLSKLNPKSRKA